MIVYIEKPKEGLYKKLLKPIREFKKVAGYKVNTQKSNLFLYTRNFQLYVKQRTPR